MTALGGIWSRNGGAECGERCEAMLRAQACYANRPRAVETRDNIALGRALYATLPEDRFDRGLQSSADGRLLLAADVRLDNRADLIAELGLSPEQGARLCDAAIVLRCWERWGDAALARFNGDFALALWDGKSIVLARDFAGQRPLFYHSGGDCFAFSSMPMGLLALPQISREPDRAALSAYISLLPDRSASSFFRDIKRVRPGHFLRITDGVVAERRFWHPPEPSTSLSQRTDYDGRVRDTLDRAVKARLRRTGELGCHLSAGLDSGGVMASAALQLGGGETLTAFTAAPPADFTEAAPPGFLYDESELASQAAAKYPNVDHVIVRSLDDDMAGCWDRVVALMQAPLPNPCNYLWVAAINDAAAARNVGVVLTGSMGNFTFSHSGNLYPAELLARGKLVSLFRELRLSLRNGSTLRGLAGETLYPLLPVRLQRAWDRAKGRRTSLAEHGMARADMREAATEMNGDVYIGEVDRDRRKRTLDTLEWLDPGPFNKAVLGCWGIDMRDPTADRELFELCLSLPERAFRKGGQSRGLAKRVLAGRLPDAQLHERRRGYQFADWHLAMRRSRDSLSQERDRSSQVDMAKDMLDMEALAETIAELDRGGTPDPATALKLRRGVLRGLAAGHFMRRASGSNH